MYFSRSLDQLILAPCFIRSFITPEVWVLAQNGTLMVATIGLLKLPDISRSSKLLYLHSSYLGICFRKIEALANILPHCIFETQSLEHYMGLRKMKVKRFPSDIICVPGVFLESITLLRSRLPRIWGTSTNTGGGDDFCNPLDFICLPMKRGP